LEKWISEAIKLDDWEVISETEPYSSSVVDTFSMFFELLEYLGNFYFLEHLEGSSQLTFTAPLAHTIRKSLSYYTREVQQRAHGTIEDMQGKGIGGWSKKSVDPKEAKLGSDRPSKVKRVFASKKEALTGLRKKIPGKAASLRKKEKLSGSPSNFLSYLGLLN